MLRRAALITSLAVTAAPAYADAFCAQLEDLFDGATSITGPKDAAGSCSPSLAQSGAMSMNCNWSFAYRSAQATDAFETLTDAVQTCLGPDAALTDDLDVNHPDFYDLRIFATQAGEVSVSLKDKGALQQTYVFLNVTPAH